MAAVAVALALVGSFAAGGAGAAQNDTKAQKKEKSERVTKQNACSVIRRADIEAAFGGDVQRGVRRRVGPDFECNWSVGASGERPAGTLRIAMGFDVPPGAYPALTNNPQFEIIEGVGTADVLFQPLSATMHVFKGRRLLRVQGIFNDATTRPIVTYDARAELVELAELAEPRL